MRTWKDGLSYLLSLGKWTLLSLLAGILGGGIGALFLFLFDLAAAGFQKIPWLFCLLPLFGLLIVLSYRLLKRENDRGTNEVILSVQTGETVSPLTMPLIMLGALLTQLGGGSAGREGAALQIGGSLGSNLGRLFRLPDSGRILLSLCGMSAVFSAVFGTPFAASLFVLEFTSIGVIHVSAFPACLLSSLAALSTSRFLGASEAAFPVPEIPALSFSTLGPVLVLALAAGAVSILFCLLLHGAEALSAKLLPNPFLRIAAGGLLLVLL
ncbi:MAG: chloride channel protein, partial [Clostridia bacterium]|nr:chloride channel protein [Clostridia bacterium]